MTTHQRIQQSRLLVDTYLQHLDAVEGWCPRTAAAMMAELIWHQESQEMSGAIGEIGIHHGKSFLILALAARPGDRKFAIDVFGMQERNTDRSGKGDRGIFEAHLRRYAPDCDVEILEMDSLELRGREAEFGLDALRFLSIDGGHTKHVTANDLAIADRTLVDGGACVVDDILHAHWTGVISGVFEFMSYSTTLVPAAIIPNKLVLCRPNQRELYLAFMRETWGRALVKSDLEFGNGRIDVFGTFPEFTGSEYPSDTPRSPRRWKFWPRVDG